MTMINHKVTLVLLGLLLVGLASCSAPEDQSGERGAQAQRTASMKLGPPVEEMLFSLPNDRTYVHDKVSERGNAVAFWVRRPNSVQLFVTDHPHLDFKGHVGFQKDLAFHVIQPKGDLDVRIAGENAEKDAWLVWGPGEGIQGEPLDNYLLFDQTGKHVVFALYDKGRWSWILNNKPLVAYHRLVPPVLSHQAKTIAWIDGDKGAQRVVINGEPGQEYDEIYENSLYVSPGGDHFFYMGSRSGKMQAVWDGSVHPEFTSLTVPVFDADGTRVAYTAYTDDRRMVAVVDGRPGTPYDKVAAFTFGPNGRRLAHRAHRDGKAFFVIDGEEGAEFDNLSDEFLFSSDGQRIAYAGIRGETWYIVVDGAISDGSSGIFGMTFSKDGQHFAMGEIDANGSLHVSVDGVRRWSHRGEPVMRPRFSPDGSRILYGIRRNSRVMLVVDGIEGQDFDAIGSIAFSPDGKHLAFFARTDSKKDAVFLDGEMQQEFDSIPCSPTFTSSGQLVYCGYVAGKMHMVIDETVGKPYDRIYLSSSREVFLDDEGNLAYVGIDGDNVVRVTHRQVEY